MRSFDWDKPILGKLTAIDLAEVAVGGGYNHINTCITHTILLEVVNAVKG